MREGITFETGALIALERNRPGPREVLERANELRMGITGPSA